MTVNETQKNTNLGWYEYVSSYWSAKSPEIPNKDMLASSTIGQLRKYSENLTEALVMTKEKIKEISTKLHSAERDTQKCLTEALTYDASAYEKLQELINKTYDIKHSVFTTLPDSKQFATRHFPADPLHLSQKTNWDHYDALNGQIDIICSQPTSEEALQAIDSHLSKLIFLTNKLALRKVSMIREAFHQKSEKLENLEDKKRMLEISFAEREKQFQEICSTLLQSKEKLKELCFQDSTTPPSETTPQEQQTFYSTYSSYFTPVIQMIKAKTYETGFESQPNNIFHRLITEYLQANEAALQSMEQYQNQCNATFKIFQEHEQIEHQQCGYVELKLHIESLIVQKDQFARLLSLGPQESEQPFLPGNEGYAGNFDWDP